MMKKATVVVRRALDSATRIARTRSGAGGMLMSNSLSSVPAIAFPWVDHAPKSATDTRRQLIAFFTSALILASSVGVNSFSAKTTGHIAPSSRFAASLKPNVAYRVLNFCAGWKKQTTSPSLAYAGIPYQVLGERAGALALMIAWSRLAMARSGSRISAIFARTALSPSALSARGPRPADPFRSWRYSFIAARSSSVNPLTFLLVGVVLWADFCLSFFGLIGIPLRLRWIVVEAKFSPTQMSGCHILEHLF